MAINFPDAPTTGDTHTVGDKTWTFDGTAWNLVLTGPNTDHGALLGLGDDDHTQYLLADGTRTATELTVSGDLKANNSLLWVKSLDDTVNIGKFDPGYDPGTDPDTLQVWGGTYVAGKAIIANYTGSFVHLNSDFAGGFEATGDAVIGGDLTVDTNTLHVDSTNNRVGIGTTTPPSTLTISGINTSAVPIVDVQTTGSGGYQRGIRLLNSGLANGEELLYGVGQADDARNMGQLYFAFTSSGSTSNRLSLGLHSVDDVINILGTGNVGIGTTSPDAKLHVNGEIIHAAQWAGVAAPSSWVSAYINNWGQTTGSGSFMTASSTGITINRSGRYHVIAAQRCNSASDTYFGIGENGNRATLDSRASGVWSHDHMAVANAWTKSIYVGYLAAGEKLTAGAPNSGNAALLLFGPAGYAGYMVAIWLGD